MREIKFRAWLPDMKQMEYDPKMGSFRAMEIVRLNESLAKFPHLMSYTGLKDKNGKEIYEGDIVAWDKAGTQFKDQVVYDKGRYWLYNFFMASFDDVNDAFGEGLSMLYVIGNVWETPELLK